MSATPDPAELEQRLFHHIHKDGLGMLGLVGGPAHHLQPMTAFCEEGGGPLWFFTRKDNELIAEGGAGAAAMFCVIGKDRDIIACLGGWLSQDTDRARVEQFWNPIAAAWFPQGKADPNLALLKFTPDDAQVWLSHTNPVRFAFAIAKANLTKTIPDVGAKQHLDL